MAEEQINQRGEWLALAQAAYQESTTYFDSGVRREIEDDVRQFQGRHPQDSKYESPMWEKKSRFFRPKTRAAIRRSEAKTAAALFSNSDVVAIDPEDQDDKLQVAGAKVLHELLNIRLTRHVPWFLIAQGAFQDAKALGVCISHQCWQFDERRKIDRPVVDLIPVENFRFSPGAKWYDVIGSSPYLIELIPMYVKDVKARTKHGDEIAGKWLKVDEVKILTAARSAADSVKSARDQGRADTETNASAVNDYSIVYVHRNIVDKDGEDWLFYTLGATEMLSTPIKLSEAYLHGERPYTMGFTILEAHRIYPSGTARLTRDTQAEVNEVANVTIDNWKLAMSKRWFARRGSNVDTRSLTRNIASSVTMVSDIEKDVKQIEFNDVPASAAQMQAALNVDFDDLAGNFSTASIDSNRKLAETVGGMELLSGESNELELYSLRTFSETWLKPTIRQLTLLLQFYETDEGLLKLAGKAAGMLDDGVNEINAALMMTPVQVAVHVGIGATSPTTRLNQLIWVLTKLTDILEPGVLTKAGLDVEEVVSELFGKMGYDSGARFFQWGERDPQIMLLEAQIAELQKAVDQKDPPEVIAAKVELLQAQAAKALADSEKSKAEKVESGVRATFGAMQAAEVVAAVPAVAPVADVIMRAAGYVEPTPPGIDPGFAPGEQVPGSATPMQAAADLSIDPVVNKRTGIGFQPGDGSAAPAGAADRELPPGVPRNTNPLTPKAPASPMSPNVGANAGIETMRDDTQGPQR